MSKSKLTRSSVGRVWSKPVSPKSRLRISPRTSIFAFPDETTLHLRTRICLRYMYMKYNIKRSDLVVMMEPDAKRKEWPLARLVQA